MAPGDIIICSDDVKDGAGAADAVGQELDVVDAALVDADSPVVVNVLHLRDLLDQFVLVAAVGVDLGVLGT